MNILAIDTSSEYLSLALQKGLRQQHILEKVGNKQSEYILPQINNLLEQNNLKISDVNLIAYNQGPGSFTGLRIGLSVAMGIALGSNIELVPIPAFALYAANAKSKSNSNKMLVAIDARLNQLYLAGINTQTFDYFLDPMLIDPAKVPYIDESVLVGNGFKQYWDLLSDNIKNLLFLDLEYPNAENMLDLAISGKYMKIKAHDASLLYLRDKVALNLAEQHQLKQKT